MMARQIKTVLTLALVTGLLTACSSNPAARLSAPEHYSKRVQMQLDDGDLPAAESTLGEMELYYPRAVATQAMQLKLISAYYKSAAMDQTVAAAKRYVSTFPNSDDLDQAHYLGGMANYDRGLRYLNEGPHEKSPLHAKAARESFAALLRCCVESRYATEASEKAAYLDEALAQYEFGLMRADLLKGNRMAAAAKGNALIASYPVTNAAGVAEVMLAAMDKPKVLDRLLIASALTINQDEAEAVATKAGMTIAAPVVASADNTAADRVTTAAAPIPEPMAMSAVKATLVALTPELLATEPKLAPPVAEAAPVKAAAVLNEPPANRYTVQLGSSRRLATVQRYMQRLGLADTVSYELRMVNGEPWHAASHGAYATLAAAQRVAAELMARTGATDLWVRPLGAVPVEPHEPRTLMAATETTKARPVEVAKARAVGRYAIQVASEQSLDSLKAEMRIMKLEGQVEYHRRVVNERAVYSALYGAYNDIQSARAELAGLQGRINRDGLWIRAIDASQKVAAE